MPDQRLHPEVAALDKPLLVKFTRTSAAEVNVTNDMSNVYIAVTGNYEVPVNLPHPSEVPGRLLFIVVVGASSGRATLNTGANNCKPKEYGTVDGLTLGAGNETNAVLLYSSGDAWYPVSNYGL